MGFGRQFKIHGPNNVLAPVVDWGKGDGTENIPTSRIGPTSVRKIRTSELYPAMLYAFLAYRILEVFFNVLYLVGVKLENSCYMMPTLVARVLGIFFYTIENCIFAFSASMEAAELVGWLVGEVVAIYFFLVLNSYYQQLSQGLLQSDSMIMPQSTSRGQKQNNESSFIISQQQPQQSQYHSVDVPYGNQIAQLPPTSPPTYDSVYLPTTAGCVDQS